jgi:hypothetical protein
MIVLQNLQTRTNVVWFGQQNLGYNDFLRNLSVSRIASARRKILVTTILFSPSSFFPPFPSLSPRHLSLFVSMSHQSQPLLRENEGARVERMLLKVLAEHHLLSGS